MEYPAHREADVALRDGSTARVRPVRPEDRRAFRDFLQALSPASRSFRFAAADRDADTTAGEAVSVDHRDQVGLVATAGGRIVAHAGFIRSDGSRARVAFTVADDYQGRGLGTILLGHLAEAAAESGVRTLTASVPAADERMLEVVRESGFPARMRRSGNVIDVEIPASVTDKARERYEERERVSAVAAISSFLAPRSVAVIGASRSRGTIGGEIFHNLLEGGFAGPVYPVNPKARVVQSVAAYRSVLDVPGEVDLAVIVVPAAAVADTARECARKGVRGLVVISAGFSEVGGEGAERQRELLQVCREAGMRLIGPNCMGIVNTDPSVGLNGTFAPARPPPGRVGFLSQSGALGLAVIDNAASLGLGLSSFVSVGNKADISGNDLIQYWEADQGTDLILLYLESFGNPRKFGRIARRVGKTKPIVAVKSGRSAAGARATSSHTGAMLAASDVTVDALFHQTGVIRTDTLHEMFDVAALLAHQPAPRGDRVAIVTNAGGPGILCSDACEAEGLRVDPLPDPVRKRLASFLVPEASTENPVDMIASATAEDYGHALREIAASGAADAVIVIFIPPLVTRTEDVARAIREAATEFPPEIPLLAVFMSARGIPAELRGADGGIPSYAFPEDAARALARAARYGAWRVRPEGRVPDLPGIRAGDGDHIVAGALGEGPEPRWLGPAEVQDLLGAYGIPTAGSRMAATAEAAGVAAEELGGEVALKAVAPGLIHKTEAGAVRLGLRGADAVAAAAREMGATVAAAGHRVEGFLVQRMVPPGVEMLIGLVHDRTFGPVVACGAGGTAVELVNDVQVRLTPLTDVAADDMVRSLATFPLLDGYRGAPTMDVQALLDILLRVSALAEDRPEVAEMDCNPVIVHPDGAVVVDARARVHRVPHELPLAARRPV